MSSPRLLCPLAALLIWQGICSAGWVNGYVLASPAEICAGMWELTTRGMPPGYLLHRHVVHSLGLVGAGFLTALALGIPLGVLLGGSRRARGGLGPFLEFFRPIPPLAWIPISMLWFGIGFKSAVFIIFLGAFFPVLVNTCAGVRGVPAGLVGVAQVLGASRRDVWLKVLLPAALPSILTGVRLSMGIAWMTLVAAEFTGVQQGYGLGYMIMTARDLQRLDLIMAGMAVIGCIGIGIECCLTRISRYLLRWRKPCPRT